MSTVNKAKALLDGQKRILGMLNDDRPLSETLAAICRVAEHQGDGMYASILLLDERGERLLLGAAPSLPAGYNKAIHGMPVGTGTAPCSTAAATGEPCTAEDIAAQARWAAFRPLAYDTFGLAACWSTPIKAYDGRVIATFALYHHTPKKPAPADRKLIDFSAHLVAIAVNRQRELAQLKTP